MAETALDWNQCGCGCRPADTHGTGCPCRECQPGGGIDHLAQYNRRSRRHTNRMQELLQRHFLTPAETAELDALLEAFVNNDPA